MRHAAMPVKSLTTANGVTAGNPAVVLRLALKSGINAVNIAARRSSGC